jgi:hypothetical protein
MALYFKVFVLLYFCHPVLKQHFRKFSSVLASSAQDVRRRRNPETSRNIVFLRKYTIIIIQYILQYMRNEEFFVKMPMYVDINAY